MSAQSAPADPPLQLRSLTSTGEPHGSARRLMGRCAARGEMALGCQRAASDLILPEEVAQFLEHSGRALTRPGRAGVRTHHSEYIEVSRWVQTPPTRLFGVVIFAAHKTRRRTRGVMLIGIAGQERFPARHSRKSQFMGAWRFDWSPRLSILRGGMGVELIVSDAFHVQGKLISCLVELLGTRGV